MKLNTKSLALLIALAVILIGSVMAISAAQPIATGDVELVSDNCGDLRMDEQYACRNGGWVVTPTPVGRAGGTDALCSGLPLDEFYACRAAGWVPATNEPVLSR